MRRPGRCAQLIVGSALVVLLLMLAATLNRGMARVLVASGSSQNVILLGAGSEESIERSEVAPSVSEIAAAAIPGLRLVYGQPAVSGEVHYNGLVETADGGTSQALLRGVSHRALWVHQEVRILEGHFPRAGEVMVGRFAHHKLETDSDQLALGQTVRFNDGELTVSGVFDAPGTVMEAELWMNVGDLLTLTQRDSLSCVVVALDRAELEDVDVFTKQRLDLELVAMRESDYYAKLARFYAPVRWMAWVCAALIAAGAIFGGLNTLYAAFASRIREFGALQAVGFKRRALLLSLLQESSAATIAGSLLAATVGLLCLDGLTIPFSIGAFSLRFDPDILALGMGAGIILGIVGTLPPAWSCLSPKLTATLRAAL
ncbi:MAG: putative ABC transport system permease protein [Limisphaerales bacterium]|jgi:putative ABC transport system permease protein